MFRGRHWPLALMHRHPALGWDWLVHYSAFTFLVKLHTCAEAQLGRSRGAAGLRACLPPPPLPKWCESHPLEAAVLKLGLQPAGLLWHARRLRWVCRLRVARHLGVTEDSGAEPGPSSACCFAGRRSTGHTVRNSCSPASLKVRRRPGRSTSSAHSAGRQLCRSSRHRSLGSSQSSQLSLSSAKRSRRLPLPRFHGSAATTQWVLRSMPPGGAARRRLAEKAGQLPLSWASHTHPGRPGPQCPRQTFAPGLLAGAPALPSAPCLPGTEGEEERVQRSGDVAAGRPGVNRCLPGI